MKAISSIFQHLSDVVWPSDCLYCGRSEQVNVGGVCDTCWESLVPPGSFTTQKKLDRLWICFKYDDRHRTLVHYLKFRHHKNPDDSLASKMNERLDTPSFNPEKSLLVPVLDHPSRRRERGYNPAGLLAQKLGDVSGSDYRPDYVIRVHHGPHQSVLTTEEREKTMRGSFSIRLCEDEATTLVLFDDVTRTGNTFNRFAREARNAGWKRVEAICMYARAVNPGWPDLACKSGFGR